LSSELLHSNLADWFESDESRVAGIQRALVEALGWLEERLGANVSDWQWGKLHRLGAVHPAASTPLQHEMLDVPLSPHAGGASTLAAAFHTPPGTFETKLGANYRLLADLGPSGDTRAICWPGQSGHAGSAHYADQVDAHLSGGYRDLPLSWEAVLAQATHRSRIEPV
jgi:penicillin amidase